MITFEEALNIARRRGKVDYFREYSEAYIFGQKKYMTDDEDEREYIIGGPDMPFVVLKENGRVTGIHIVIETMPEIDLLTVVREGSA